MFHRQIWGSGRHFLISTHHLLHGPPSRPCPGGRPLPSLPFLLEVKCFLASCKTTFWWVNLKWISNISTLFYLKYPLVKMKQRLWQMFLKVFWNLTQTSCTSAFIWLLMFTAVISLNPEACSVYDNCCCSVAKLCLTLHDPMDCRPPICALRTGRYKLTVKLFYWQEKKHAVCRLSM